MAKLTMDKAKAKELLVRAKKQYETDSEAEHQNRRDAQDDLRFLHIPGEQWDAKLKTARGLRPCYEFNKTRITVKRIVNDMRANRPSGKVRGVEDGDKDTADVYEGLIRNIWNVSDGDTAIDHAAEFQVGCGMGAWRVMTEYSTDEAFDQDICIEPIKNPLTVYWDAAAQEPLKRDARRWFITSMMDKEVFEDTYPDAEAASFDEDPIGDRSKIDIWVEDTMLRVCEYWYKEPVTKQILLLNDGVTVDASKLDPALLEQLRSTGQIVKEREVKADRIMMVLMSGHAILTDPVEWVGKEFPFIVVFGEEIFLDGRNRWFGLTRFAKDAQRSYNVSRTNMIESVQLAPQAKWWATPKQIQGLEASIAEAHLKNFPYMLYNPDTASPGPPQRMGSADVPVALVQEMQIASDDIKAVTGIFDNSLGKQANETSGVAIRSRQAQGEIATFNYMDNLSKGIRRTWEILVDIIPKVIDTARAIRILGSDGGEKYIKVNHIDPATGEMENDLSRGKYDVTITVGPSFSTQRQEAAEVYGQLAQANPEIYQVAGDLIFKAMDLPYSQDIADRLKLMLPPPIQQMINQDKPVPPEVQAQMQQVQQAMQQVQQHGQLVEKAAEEARKEQTDAKSAKADVQIQQSKIDVQLSQIKVAEANLATDVANFKTLIAQAQKDMGQQQEAAATDNLAEERAQLSEQVNTVLSDIVTRANDFQQKALETIHGFQQQRKPRIAKLIVTHTPTGSEHTPIYDDGNSPPNAQPNG